jgi:chromosome segregation ATPase
VPEKIQSLRTRYAQISGSLGHYEKKVERQTRELERMNRGDDWGEEEDEDEEDKGDHQLSEVEEFEVTDDDLRREEEEIAELERKRRELEERVKGMERDLGGLLR